MAYCIELAKQALNNGNPPVGSIIILDDQIIGEGIESVKPTNDVTNHAEIVAIRDAISKGHFNDLPKSALYSTHEPCIMCSYLIRQHKIPLIVYGSAVDHIGGHSSKFDILSTESVSKWEVKPKIIGGILKSECTALTSQYQHNLNK